MLPETEKYQGETYLVWDTRRDTFTPRPDFSPRPELGQVAAGRYLVDSESGRVRWLKDPGIMGKLDENRRRRQGPARLRRPQDPGDGHHHHRRPGTQAELGPGAHRRLDRGDARTLRRLVAPVRRGRVRPDPVFDAHFPRRSDPRRGGLVGGPLHAAAVSAATDPEAKARAEIEAIRKSETSSGVLLASGFIAGGSLAGMLLAFTNFSDTLPEVLSAWQYRTERLAVAQPFKDAAEDIGRRELHLPAPGLTLKEDEQRKLDAFVNDMADLNSDELIREAPVPAGTRVRLPNRETYLAEKPATLGEVARETLGSQQKAVALMKLNRQELVPYVAIPKGTRIRLPDYTTFVVEEPTTLGALAEKLLGSADEAAALMEHNRDLELPPRSPGGIARLKPAESLPAGAALEIPQTQWPAVILFAALAAFLTVVGAGWLLRSPSEDATEPIP